MERPQADDAGDDAEGDADEDELFGGAPAHGWRLAWSLVEAWISLAVEVLPDTTAVTLTVSPTATAEMPISPESTLVPESTTYVMAVLSALVTVKDHVLVEESVSVAAVTWPVWTSNVSYPLGP